jgi:hypothetical protein
MNGNYIAAVYDFRSKQDYIYRTNRVQEACLSSAGGFFRNV